MSSKTERHVSPLFFPGFDEGLPSAGPHVCPAAPSQPLQDQAKPILTTSLCSQGSHSSPVLGAGGRRESPLFFFFSASPFILLQALIIEELNLSCSCLLPSFPDSVSNKGP